MPPAHQLRILWLATCAMWLTMLAIVLISLRGLGGWTDVALATLVYGIVPLALGSALIRWGFGVTPWRVESLPPLGED